MPSSPSVDEFIERVVREVIRRLQTMGTPHQTAAPVQSGLFLPERLITAATILAVPKGTTRVLIVKHAILTPLARDEARDRGIQFERIEKGQQS